MAVRSNIELRGYFEDLPSGSSSIVLAPIVNTNAPIVVTQLSLANGDNSFAPPANSAGVIIVFDPTSTTVKKLKGAGGDTGIALSKVRWIVLSFDASPPAAIIINSTGADTGKLTELTYF